MNAYRRPHFKPLEETPEEWFARSRRSYREDLINGVADAVLFVCLVGYNLLLLAR